MEEEKILTLHPEEGKRFSRSERMAKWNEGLRIEEALGSKALIYPARRLFGRARS